jgi:hypothetical protein
MTFLGRWDRFWFEDVRSELFAVLRIAIGVTGLYSLLGFLPVDAFWSLDGISPLPGSGFGLRSYILASGLSPVLGWLIFLTLALSFICMILGLYSGVAVAACFLGSMLQPRWNPLPLTSGHTIMVAVLFCLVWADCGACFSLDAWRRRRRGDDSPPTLQAIWPLRLIRAQVAILYLASGFFKLLGAGWRDGSSVHYTTTQNVYGRIFNVYAPPVGLDWTFTLLTYLTLAWELAFPLMLWNRTTRALALLTGIGMHLGIWATMEVGPFSWVMLASYFAFIDPDAAAAALRRVLGRRPMASGSAVQHTISSPGAAAHSLTALD